MAGKESLHRATWFWLHPPASRRKVWTHGHAVILALWLVSSDCKKRDSKLLARIQIGKVRAPSVTITQHHSSPDRAKRPGLLSFRTLCGRLTLRHFLARPSVTGVRERGSRSHDSGSWQYRLVFGITNRDSRFDRRRCRDPKRRLDGNFAISSGGTRGGPTSLPN
jgi:hypothetical protein